jgi:hypothetical protein
MFVLIIMYELSGSISILLHRNRWNWLYILQCRFYTVEALCGINAFMINNFGPSKMGIRLKAALVRRTNERRTMLPSLLHYLQKGYQQYENLNKTLIFQQLNNRSGHWSQIRLFLKSSCARWFVWRLGECESLLKICNRLVKFKVLHEASLNRYTVNIFWLDFASSTKKTGGLWLKEANFD